MNKYTFEVGETVNESYGYADNRRTHIRRAQPGERAHQHSVYRRKRVERGHSLAEWLADCADETTAQILVSGLVFNQALHEFIEGEV